MPDSLISPSQEKGCGVEECSLVLSPAFQPCRNKCLLRAVREGVGLAEHFGRLRTEVSTPGYRIIHFERDLELWKVLVDLSAF